jgi:plasmid rolling circle replication initiator protein Rep
MEQYTRAGNFVELEEASPKDAPWTLHRSTSDTVETIFKEDDDLLRYSERINKCANTLTFNETVDTSTGELGLKLKRTFFCRVRTCPVCQWRRSLMWKAKMYQAMPEIKKQHPTAQWLFLTLTQKNVPASELKSEIQNIHKAWNRFLVTPFFRHVKGWVRSLEVTRGADGSAHPHIHCMILVSSTYYKGGNYISQPKWVAGWKHAMRLDYDPVVDIRKIQFGKLSEAKAVAETLKYTIKPADMTADPEWLRTVVKQLHRVRSVATGGVLKDLLSTESTQEELLLLGNDETKPKPEEIGDEEINFAWHRAVKRYRRRKLHPPGGAPPEELTTMGQTAGLGCPLSSKLDNRQKSTIVKEQEQGFHNDAICNFPTRKNQDNRAGEGEVRTQSSFKPSRKRRPDT